MNKSITNFMLIFSILVFSGCAGATNFSDGSWSNCTYSKDGRVIKAPLQVGPVAMGWTEKDGTKVECVPIAKAE